MLFLNICGYMSFISVGQDDQAWMGMITLLDNLRKIVIPLKI